MAKESDICEPEVMESEELLFMLYTSGSTGKPKGIAHSTAGYLLYAMMTQKVTLRLAAPLSLFLSPLIYFVIDCWTLLDSMCLTTKWERDLDVWLTLAGSRVTRTLSMVLYSTEPQQSFSKALQSTQMQVHQITSFLLNLKILSP